jgi:hypothetical protein
MSVHLHGVSLPARERSSSGSRAQQQDKRLQCSPIMPAGIPPPPPCSCAMRFARIAASSEPVAFEQQKARSVRPCIASFVQTPGLTCCEHHSLFSMFEATGAVWKRRRKPVATEIRTCCAAASAAADTAVETARAKVSRQRWDRAASSTSSAPQASAIRTVLLHTGARAVACILAPGLSPCKRQRRQDAAEQRQRLDSGGHILRSSLKSELQETHLRLRRAHPAGRSSFSPNSLVPRIQIFPWGYEYVGARIFFVFFK